MSIKKADIVIVGAGILGTTLSYVLSSLSNAKIILIEQESLVGFHSSSRNTGKVHAPFIYDPEKKKVLAKAALYGYKFYNDYCKIKKIGFKEDGIIEVAIDEKGTKTIYNHLEWGLENGLEKKDIQILEKRDIEKFEPNVLCNLAIFCKKDASVDYGNITRALAVDSIRNKVDLIMNSKVSGIILTNKLNERISLKYRQYPNDNCENEIRCDFLINATGGRALSLMKLINPYVEYKNLYFRGEYWIAPPKYKNLTKHSIYSVPEFQQFPFLDPHWIIKSNGHREIGPNACPVFSAFGYNFKTNLKEFFPTMFEFIGDVKIKKIKNILLNKDTVKLVSKEILSSISKTQMINRVRKFLPSLKPSGFITRGSAGIRANLIDKDGFFISNPVFLMDEKSLHVLNYNSPGATGAFSISFALSNKLIEKGIIKKDKELNPLYFKEKLVLDCIKDVDIVLLKI